MADAGSPSPLLQRPRIAAIGSATMDRLVVVERYPLAGECAIIKEAITAPGGTTTNTAVALARLRAHVAIVALVGRDPNGAAMRVELERERVDTSWLDDTSAAPTDEATVIVSREPQNRTIYWLKGARLGRDHPLDIAVLSTHDVIYLDVDEAPLLRILLDSFPAQASPRPRLLGSLQYPVGTNFSPAFPGVFDLVLRHDVMTGNEREWRELTGTERVDEAVEAVRKAMPGSALAAFFVTRGTEGCLVCTASECHALPAFPVTAIDSTGAGDAFSAGVAYGLAVGWAWGKIGRFANAVGALSTRELGAQASLPTIEEVALLMGLDPTTFAT